MSILDASANARLKSRASIYANAAAINRLLQRSGLLPNPKEIRLTTERSEKDTPMRKRKAAEVCL